MPRKPSKQKPTAHMDFIALVEMIRRVDQHAGSVAKRAVNTSLTLRNWVFGLHLAEYELSGADRAEYGDRLFTELSQQLRNLKVSNTGRRQLYQYLTFYRTYPGIVRSLPAPFQQFLPSEWESRELSGQLTGNPEGLLGQNPIVGTASPLLGTPTKDLAERLSYSHLELIVDLDDPLKRAFYEIECIRGNWSVRALKRQITSLYFERSGLSIRDPYIFEFLGLKPHEAVAESDLEQGLLENLQEFLLEMGHGFCHRLRRLHPNPYLPPCSTPPLLRYTTTSTNVFSRHCAGS